MIRDKVRQSSFFADDGEDVALTRKKSFMVRDTMTHATTQVFYGNGCHLLQLGGCRNHLECALITDEYIQCVPGVSVEHIRPTLINVVLDLGKRIDLTQGLVVSLNEFLRQQSPLSETNRAEKREHYSAMIVYRPGKEPSMRVSARVFSSGSISITAQVPEDVESMFVTLTTFLHNQPGFVQELIPKQKCTQMRKRFKSYACLMADLNLCHNHPPVEFPVDSCPYCSTNAVQ
jgi:hypothetical protein